MTTVQDHQPVWQVTPCPPWCVARHTDSDLIDERECVSAYQTVPTSLHAAVAIPVPGGRRMVLDEIRTGLETPTPSVPADVVLAVGDDTYRRLTPTEARQLATQLTAAADQAEGATA